MVLGVQLQPVCEGLKVGCPRLAVTRGAHACGRAGARGKVGLAWQFKGAARSVLRPRAAGGMHWRRLLNFSACLGGFSHLSSRVIEPVQRPMK
jgi:hypothetical protein